MQTKTVENVEALGHNWGAVDYVWSADNTTVTATRICANDPTHKETETAQALRTVTLDPTCEATGTAEYAAGFTNPAFAPQTKIETIPALGHSYGEPFWHWASDTAKAIFSCDRCGEARIISASVAILTDNATCTEAGEKICTATVTFDGRTWTDELRTAIPALGHTPGAPVQEHVIPATTETEGSYDEVVYCSVCHTELSRTHKTIDKLPVIFTFTGVTASRPTALVGDTFTWSAAATGGTGAVKYCFYVFKDGAILERGAYGAANTYTFTAAAAGTYTVRVYAKDSANRVITLDKAAPVTVTTNAPLVITGVAADKPSAVPGEAIIWTAAAYGGSGRLQYCFYVFQNGKVVERGAYGTANVYRYVAPADGTYTVRVYVKDASGTVVTLDKAAPVTVSTAAPLTVTGVTPSAASVNMGGSVTWTAAAAGGKSPLQYCFYVFKDGKIKERGAYGAANTYTCALTETGTWTVRVYVKDASGTVVTLDNAGTVTVAGGPLTLTGVSANTTSAAVGEAITWTANASGGTAVRYCFYVFKNGQIISRGSYGTAKTFTYTPDSAGTWSVRVYAKDGSAAALQLNGGSVIVG